MRRAPFTSRWPCDVHVIGKDIVWFHAVIWPAILMSAGIELPKRVFAHGFVTGADGRKMSKSCGNVVGPHDVLAKWPSDSVRYFLCTGAPYGSDLPMSGDALGLAHNAALADGFGNLVHRVISLAHKYTDASVPADCDPIGPPLVVSAIVAEADAEWRSLAIHK